MQSVEKGTTNIENAIYHKQIPQRNYRQNRQQQQNKT
jgi:hypothetical protein